MASSQPPSRSPNPPEEPRPDREAARPDSFAAVPGWVVSGMLHAGLIVFLVTAGLPSCGDGQIGTGADQGEFREVGIYVKQSTESPTEPQDTENENTQESESTAASSTVARPSQDVDAAAMDLLAPPDVKTRAVIGQSSASPPPGGGIPSPQEALVKSNAIRTPQSKGKGPGEVTFMGQTTPAERIVYAIDTSSSMNGHDAIAYAKQKLIQSINGLTQKQLFQIITYADVAHVMKFGSASDSTIPMYRGHGINLRRATSHINSIVAVGGTQHMKALEKAFSLKPDVIFFLTDASTTGVSPRDMDTIRRTWNKAGKTHIHCFKFGSGPDLQPPSENFLRSLASENKGTYSYLDVTKLSQR